MIRCSDPPENFQKAGFHVILGHRKLMVGEHPTIPGYLVKKFSDDKSQKVQIKNYLKRIRGAKAVKAYIQKHDFKHLIVPKKWIYQLPHRFSKKGRHTYVLIVEKMEIYQWEDPNGKARELYYHMDKDILKELCTVLHDLKGCDAFPRNQPFTHSGKIAFIDTEHVGEMKGHFFKHIVPELNDELKSYAVELWNHLDHKRKRHRLSAH